MLRMLHTELTVLLIIVALDTVYSASVITEKEIGNSTVGELKIRDDIVTRNSSLEAKSSTKILIKEEFKTTSSSSVSITCPVIKKEEISEITDPTAVCVGDDHDFDSGELCHPSEEIEPSDDDVPPTVRVKRSDDDSQYTNDDYADWGYDDEDINAPEQDVGDNAGHGDIHGIMTSLVRMPTGTARDVKITIPKMTGWKHGINKTRLINLDPKGKLGGKEYEIVEDQMQQTIATHLTGNFQSYNIIKIEKVVNGFLWKKFMNSKKHVRREAGFANERMLFHGSSKIKEIVELGFDESYAQGSGMFGYGLYFAKHSSKSNQYAFGYLANCPTHNKANCDICERQTLLCRVALGKMKEESKAKKRPHAPPGHRSVVGIVTPGGLKYEEYVVYNGEQVYPEYVITYKIVL